MSWFPSAAHLTAWAGIAPAPKSLGAMLGDAAGPVGRMNVSNYLLLSHKRTEDL
jgi:hypothetical protein